MGNQYGNLGNGISPANTVQSVPVKVEGLPKLNKSQTVEIIFWR
ncbi:hypothetical protein LEP1GSC085_2345 [Leptospira interrogans str. L0996]|nr:hypothetical protein LEP1GSC085_2345 [Leptospira interrogans str. L0996]